MFEKFTDRMSEAPFVRIAISAALCGIACLIFRFNNISWIFFGVAALAFIARLFNLMFFQHIEHILMKTSMVSLWFGAQLAVVSGVVSVFLPQNEEAASGYLLTDLSKFISIFSNQGFANESIGGIVVLILAIATSASLVLFLITLLLRIIVAMFSK